MSTVINNPRPDEHSTYVEKTDSSGWVVAVIILLAVIGGAAFLWTQMRGDTGEKPGTTINVSVPDSALPGGDPAPESAN